MIELSAKGSNGLLAKRYASEKRFRAYGAIALALTTIFLGFLLYDIISKGWPAFFESHSSVEIKVDPDKVAAGDIANGDFAAIIKQSVRDHFPEVESRADKKTLVSFMSQAAGDELRDMVIAKPELIGQTIKANLLLSAEADLYYKGLIDTDDKPLLDKFNSKFPVTQSISWRFWTNGDSREPELAGLLGAIKGSLFTVGIAILIGLPLGVFAAIYLEQFARKNRWTDLIEVNINNLAAVPSIIFGLLGLAMFLNFFGLPRSAPVVGGLVLALLVLPTIIIASRAALRAVPPSIKEAALGVGASKQQAVFHHVLPLALPGILTGTILALARAFGETAPLLMIGMVAFIADVPRSPTDAATVLPVQIYLWSDLPELAFKSKTAAAIIILIVVLMLANAFAIYMRRKFERRW
jgi:phosphate transport system permease protein